MEMIEAGMKAGSPGEYITVMTDIILGFFGLGMAYKAMILVSKAVSEGKSIGEILGIIKKRLIVIAMVASIAGFIHMVEEAFR